MAAIGTYESFTEGARLARKLAQECLADARAAPAREASRLMAEHDRHRERAKDHEMRAGWYAPNIDKEDAQ